MAPQNRFKNCTIDKGPGPAPSTGSCAKERFATKVRMSPGSCQEKPNDAYTDIMDIQWYPDKKTIYVQKRDKQDLVIDLSTIIPDEQPTNKNILVWDPTLQRSKILVPEGTPYTDAMQMIATEINNNFEENFVWKIWVG